MKSFIFITAVFIVIGLETNAQNIVKLEYSIDNFVSEGKGISIDLAVTSSELDTLLEIDLTGLTPGMHTLYFRSLNDINIWSLPTERTFYISPDVTNLDEKIVKMEYSFDGFLREGNGIEIDLSGDTNEIDSTLNLGISGLDDGMHTFHARSQNSSGIWSLPTERIFYINNPDTLKVKDIYFRFINDTYTGNWQHSPVAPARAHIDTILYTSAIDLAIDSSYAIEFYAVNNLTARGLSAFTSEFVLRANHTPLALKNNLKLNVQEGEILFVSMDTLFTDEDKQYGDILVYSILDNNSSGISDLISWKSDTTITFSPNNKDIGVYNFIFIATDIGYELDSINVQLTVKAIPKPNKVPIVNNPLENLTLTNGFGSHEVVLDSVFSDPDKDDLVYTVKSNKNDVVTVLITNSTLTITEVGIGSAEITVTVDDGKGGMTSDVFMVDVVKNALPIVSNPLADLDLEEGFESVEIELGDVFTDSDDDTLTYSAKSNNDNVVAVSVVNSKLTLTETGIGSAEITVSVDDGKGGKIEIVFSIDIKESIITFIVDEEYSSQIEIFPNPASSILWVILPKMEDSELVSFLIYNLLGKNYPIDFNIYSKGYQIDVSSLQTGIYLIQILVEDKIALKKFIVE